MSGTIALLCSRTGRDPGDLTRAAVIEDLCERPDAAAAIVRDAGADRAVLGICHRHPSTELVAALRRAGVVPFGIEAVRLAGQVDERERLVAAAMAKLDALPPGERGRPSLNGGTISRRSLFSLGGALTQHRIAALDEATCAGTARCGLCVDECPTRAIAAAEPVPTIDPGGCTACGRCVPRCPQGAIRLVGASGAQLEAQLQALVPGVDGVVFACAAAETDAPRGWALVELPTLALVTPGWILQLRARGVDARLAPCDRQCCAGAGAVAELADLVCDAPLAASGATCEPLRLCEPSATADAVARLARSGERGVWRSAASPLGLIAVAPERCTLCGACVTACPTDALRLDGGGEETVLHLRAGACVGCGRCAATCPEDAIRVEARAIDSAQLAASAVDLARARRETCTVCGADLPPEPMRRRLLELLPELDGTPLGLCAACARRTIVVRR